MASVRKIIHVDMDAFFAAVEQRDNPELRGKPIAVGHDGPRGVVATASYEARKFGVHSAMASSTAKRLCPDLIFVRGHFDAYREVSRQLHEIFAEYTDLIEPVSLDEAYLDVTVNKKRTSSAWTIAQNIRDEIYKQTGLIASAGVSYNKFLAKSASDIKKPNGQFLITPQTSADFIAALPIAKFHGIGPATTEKMHRLGIDTGADLRTWFSEDLVKEFGKLGKWYYSIARGRDDRPVESHRERKSVSAETTFRDDVTERDHLEQTLLELSVEVWNWVETNKKYGRTVSIKIKWADFEQSTRSRTELVPITELSELRRIAVELLDATYSARGIRLIGIGVSNFHKEVPIESPQTQFEF